MRDFVIPMFVQAGLLDRVKQISEQLDVGSFNITCSYSTISHFSFCIFMISPISNHAGIAMFVIPEAGGVASK